MFQQLVNTFAHFTFQDLSYEYWEKNPFYYRAEGLGESHTYKNKIDNLLFLTHIPLFILKTYSLRDFGKKYPLYHLYKTIQLYRKFKFLWIIKLLGNLDLQDLNWIDTSFNFVKNMNDIELAEQAMYCITEILKE